MRRRLTQWLLCPPSLVAALGLAGSVARAQQPCPAPPPPCPTYPVYPGTAVPPGQTLQPGMTTPPGGAGTPTTEGSAAGMAETALASLGTGAGIGSSVALASPGAYLDNAIPMTMFRLRYDAGWHVNRPDRAEYFYATWKEHAFHPHGVEGKAGAFFDPNAQGPTQLPTNVNFQDVASYLEYAFNRRLSLFAEVPVRFVGFHDVAEDNPESEIKRNPRNFPAPGSPFFPEPGVRGAENPHENNNPGGLGDINVGFKAALLADPDRYLTFQFRTYVNTADPRTGLGTGHVSLEPSFLYYRRLDQLQFQAQLTDWIPIGGGPMAGNVLMYGVGLGYDIYQCGNLRITPITEFVGWTVLSGFESFFGTFTGTAPPGVDLPRTHAVEESGGVTIVNAKIGVRTYFCDGHDLYVGWGHALTKDRWYMDILRVEYRYAF